VTRLALQDRPLDALSHFSSLRLFAFFPGTCPYQLAWSDVPFANNVAHKSAECSNAGSCDRKTGTCQCYPGFEGRACDRTVCPNSCSGHGTCQSLSTFFRDQTDAMDDSTFSVSYSSGLGTWDAKKTFGCKCEAGYRGPDCSLRECPTGRDPQGGPGGVAFNWNSPVETVSARQQSEYRDCSGRGLCDYSTGICSCFKGQYGEDCSLQSALV
jgi:hypothetical protein